MSDYKQYIPGNDEPLLTAEEREAKERERRENDSRFEFHVDMAFDKAVEKLEEFDAAEPFVPGVERNYGGTRIYFRVFEEFFFRTKSYASISVLMEESPRFGVDIIAVVSGGGEGIYNLNAGINLDYANRLKKHMGVEVPQENILKKARRYLFE